MRFEWDPVKDQENRKKHDMPFKVAQYAFADPDRVIAEDLDHGQHEKRDFCFGIVGGGVLTVRFTVRERINRIFGAGYWRNGKRNYEKRNKIH